MLTSEQRVSWVKGTDCVKALRGRGPQNASGKAGQSLQKRRVIAEIRKLRRPDHVRPRILGGLWLYSE